MDIRLPVALMLALCAPAWAAAPAAAATPQAAENTGLRCTGQAAQPGSLQLQLGKSTLMRMPEAVQARSVGNPAVLQAMLVAPDTLYVVGVDIGSSNMIVQGRSGLCNVVEVVVGIDPAGLQQSLAALMPEFPFAACVPFSSQVPLAEAARARHGVLLRAAAHEAPAGVDALQTLTAQATSLQNAQAAGAFRYFSNSSSKLGRGYFWRIIACSMATKSWMSSCKLSSLKISVSFIIFLFLY